MCPPSCRRRTHWTIQISKGFFDTIPKEIDEAVLISIPIAILFLCLQRFYVDGLSGAVKG